MRWSVNRVGLSPGTADSVGEILVDGTARDEGQEGMRAFLKPREPSWRA